MSTRICQAEEKPKEKESLDIKLVGFDEKSKIKVIKEVRTITGLGLKEVRQHVGRACRTSKASVGPLSVQGLRIAFVGLVWCGVR
jgi:ribosomal protein L7/L12